MQRFTMIDSSAHPLVQPNVDELTTELRYGRQFWLLVVIAGVGAGLAGGGLMRLLFATEHMAWPFVANGTLLDAVNRSSPGRRVFVLTLAGIWVGVGAWLLRRIFGPGVDVNSAIWSRGGRIPMVATIFRAILSIVAVGLGISLGREAAVKQSGGAIASGLAQWRGMPLLHRRIFVACGVGAGMAAAYNVPFGGALFALEVLLGSLSLRLVLPAVVMSTTATAVSWLFLPSGPIYAFGAIHFSVGMIVWGLVAGPLLGIIAAIFIKAVGWGGRPRFEGAAAVVAPILTLMLLGVASIAGPQLLGNGKDSVQLAFDGRITLAQSLTVPWLKGMAVVACLACGARGGLFTPTLMIGATAGALLGYAWSLIWPGTDVGVCALVGSGAMLAASTQGPVSSVVMLFELTHHMDTIMAPVLLAVAGATLVSARLDGRSIYSARAALPDAGPAETNPKPLATVPATELVG